MKLGKPEIGYNAMRPLTRRECEITGLPGYVHIMHEHGTGNISFWTRIDGHAFSRYTMSRDEKTKTSSALHEFWGE